MSEADRTADALRREALALLETTGLADLLASGFGGHVLVGSVDLDLMTRRDIDLCVALGRDEGARLVDAIEPIRAALTAVGCHLFRISYWDEWHRPRGDYGSGHYLGLRLAASDGAEWKIDLWGWEASTFAAKRAAHEALKRDLAAADRELILALKRQVQERADLRHKVASWDVYRFVLAGRGATLADLETFCAGHRRQ